MRQQVLRRSELSEQMFVRLIGAQEHGKSAEYSKTEGIPHTLDHSSELLSETCTCEFSKCVVSKRRSKGIYLIFGLRKLNQRPTYPSFNNNHSPTCDGKVSA
jgi:hypothetical protein